MRAALLRVGVLSAAIAACAPATTTSSARVRPMAPLHGTPASDHAAVPLAHVEPGESGPLSLEQLLRFADVHAPEAAIARQRAKLGAAEVEGAESLMRHNPEVGISAGGRTSGGVSRFEFEAELEQRFEIAGERGARIEAAESSRDARLAELEVGRWRRHALVHALYYEMLVRKKQLAAAAKIARFSESLRVIVEKRVEAGEESPLKIIVAHAEISKARQLVLAAKQAYQSTSLRLAETVGWPPNTPLTVAGELAAPTPVDDVAGLVKKALQSHPSKRWLALEVRAARARIEREDREAWPEPALGLRYAREAEAGGAAHVWMGKVVVPLPIWEQNQAARARARAQLGLARARRGAFEQALTVRIAAAASRVDAAAERVRLYGSDILPAFEGNLAKLRRAFEIGEIDVLQLSQIQQQILVTQRDALAALGDYYEALAALEALSGVDVLSSGHGKS